MYNTAVLWWYWLTTRLLPTADHSFFFREHGLFCLLAPSWPINYFSLLVQNASEDLKAYQVSGLAER